MCVFMLSSRIRENIYLYLYIQIAVSCDVVLLYIFLEFKKIFIYVHNLYNYKIFSILLKKLQFFYKVGNIILVTFER